MILLAALAFVVVTTLVTFVQTLYLESLRLRTRERPALEFFKEDLEQRLGFDTEHGALTFSLLKHIVLVLGGGAFVLASWQPQEPLWRFSLEGLGSGFLALLAGGYVLPQVLYRRTDGRWLLPIAPFLRAGAWLVRPLAMLLSFFESLFELSNGHAEEDEPATASEQVEALMTAGVEEGLIEAGDRKLIQNVVEFGDKRVREVMTPRRDIVAIPSGRTLEELRDLVINERFSRIPVYEDSIDRIIGFVHVRDMFEKEDEEREHLTVNGIMRPIRAVPEFKPVSELLNEMRLEGNHMVVVSDEWGGTAGLATLEDLVEEVFGEIRDEHEPEADVVEEPGGAIVVSGSWDLDHLQERFGFHPEEGLESTSVGGLITEWMGEVPAVGASVERDGIHLEVLAANEMRIEKVRIRKSL